MKASLTDKFYKEATPPINRKQFRDSKMYIKIPMLTTETQWIDKWPKPLVNPAPTYEGLLWSTPNS